MFKAEDDTGNLISVTGYDPFFLIGQLTFFLINGGVTKFMGTNDFKPHHGGKY